MHLGLPSSPPSRLLLQFSSHPNFQNIHLGSAPKALEEKCNGRDFVILAGVVHRIDVDWSISCRFLGVALSAHLAFGWLLYLSQFSDVVKMIPV